MSWIAVVLGMLAAQSADGDASVKRVRAALAVPASPLTIRTFSVDDTQPVFRVWIERPRPFQLAPPWQPDTTVPGYVRTTRPLHHHEFLLMVTPEEFRAGVLYPGMDLLPLFEAPVRAIAAGVTTVRERRARDKVAKELQRLQLTPSK